MGRGRRPGAGWLLLSDDVLSGSVRRVAARGRATDDAAAAAVAKPAVAIKPSGFLDSYAGLRKSPTHEGSWVWMKEGLDLRVFDHLMIDPVEVILDEEGQKLVTDEMRKKASDAFREILVETIDPYYEIVDAPGEHVLRVRLALTDLQPEPAMEEGKPAVQTTVARSWRACSPIR